MADSLRLRLLAWHAGMVALVIISVATAVCWATWRFRLAEVDEELRARAESVASAVQPGAGGGYDVELNSDAIAYFQSTRTLPYYAVWSASGALVDRSDPEIAGTAAPDEGVRHVGYRRELVTRRNGLTVMVGRDVSAISRELWSLALTMAAVGAAGIAAALGGAWFLAGRALGPVQRINETARRMASGDLSSRIAVDHTETELGQVALALNLAFDRLRESIDQQRQFTADASHQLRTPVATMIAELAWALRRDRTAAEYRESLETCQRAAGRMQGLVQGLLTLARADSGELPLDEQEVRLDLVAADAADTLMPLAARRGVRLSTRLEPAAVIGDRDRLHDLISNLLFNAIAYNRPDGTVTVGVRSENAEAQLRVNDTGMGIGAADLPNIFDRFYRGETARTREPAGAGLGLALAQWITSAHGGSIACTSEPGVFTEFLVRVPAAAQAATVSGTDRRNARLITPPATPRPSTESVSTGVHIVASPSAASSE